ncbi:hypothetical protein [Alcanivorax sp. DP30]|nr:hypothetical protein [Alcanivorax sp. DP30]
MENQEVLDLEWMPNHLDSLFEDAHADTAGQWEYVSNQLQDSKAA